MERLNRLVKLHFKPGKAEDFKKIFEYGQHVVAGSEGCHGVQLLQDRDEPDIAFTYSLWDSEEDLNRYRHSKAFREYWPKIKSLLADKAEVWNLSLMAEKKA